MDIRSASGILVVRRVDYFAEGRFKTSPVSPSVDLGNSDVLTCYRGIEGEPWPLEPERVGLDLSSGLVPLHCLDKVLGYFHVARKCFHCDLIYIDTVQGNTPQIAPPNGFWFCGFDFGWYQSEYNLFSAIFNEIIYGRYSELRFFGAKLNENLLLPSMADISAFVQARQQLIEKGADLETAEEGDGLGPIAVYCALGIQA